MSFVDHNFQRFLYRKKHEKNYDEDLVTYARKYVNAMITSRIVQVNASLSREQTIIIPSAKTQKMS